MLQALIGAFDAGVSYGVSDIFFKTLITDYKRLYKYPITDQDVPFGITPLLGKGLKIDLSSSNVKDTWLEKVNSELLKDDNIQLASVMNHITPGQLFLVIYSIGVCFIRFDLEYEENYEQDCIHLYRYFEKVLYDHVSIEIKKIVKKYIDNNGHKAIKKNIIHKVSKRFDISDKADNDLIPGMICVNICNDKISYDNSKKIIGDYEKPNSLISLDTDDGEVALGWASSAFYSTQKGFERNLFLYQLSLCYYETCKAYDMLYSSLLIKNVNAVFTNQRPSYDFNEINVLRTLSNTVIHITCYLSSSENICDRMFFEAFDTNAKIHLIHNRIRETSEIFSNLQNNEIVIKNEKRDKVLNQFGKFITLLTLISVSTDIISTVDYNNLFIPEPYNRILLLCIPPFLCYLILYFVNLFFGKNKRY